MHFDFTSAANSLAVVLSIITFVLAHLHFKNQYVQMVLKAIVAAEKFVDKTAYKDDGTYNKAREDFAIAFMRKAAPMMTSAQEARIRLDMEVILGEIHDAVKAQGV